MDDPNMAAYHQAEEELAAKVRLETAQRCASVLLGERRRLLTLQGKAFSGSREAQIRILDAMVRRLRKMK